MSREARGRAGPLERRLFGWLLLVAVVPPFVLLALGTWIGAGTVGWVATLEPWERVAETQAPTWVDSSAPAGAVYAVSAYDRSGNESPRATVKKEGEEPVR